MCLKKWKNMTQSECAELKKRHIGDKSNIYLLQKDNDFINTFKRLKIITRNSISLSVFKCFFFKSQIILRKSKYFISFYFIKSNFKRSKEKKNLILICVQFQSNSANSNCVHDSNVALLLSQI